MCIDCVVFCVYVSRPWIPITGLQISLAVCSKVVGHLRRLYAQQRYARGHSAAPSAGGPLSPLSATSPMSAAIEVRAIGSAADPSCPRVRLVLQVCFLTLRALAPRYVHLGRVCGR